MRYRRLYIPGGTYFFTVAIANRECNLLTENISILKLAFKKVKRKYPFSIDAIVILPDHFHMIMTLPNNEVNFSTRIGLIKSFFSRNIPKIENLSNSRKTKRERSIWQRRFWEHSISNEKDFLRHVNYIHYNPVKHGYVTKPSAWKYSSIHRYIRNGILSQDWST